MTTNTYGWLFAALVLSACAQSNVEKNSGGQTNWLMTCTDDQACEQGSCVCGVCTTPCDSNSQCADSFAGSCIEVSSTVGASACEGETPAADALCLPACEADQACGEGFACRSSVCITELAAARFDEAVNPPMADASDDPVGPDGSTRDSSIIEPVGFDSSIIEPVGPDASSDGGERDSGAPGPDGSVIWCNCDAEVQSLACVCDEINCLAYEDAIDAHCQGGNPSPSLLATGCGIQIVTHSAGLSRSVFAYLGESKALIGASYRDDLSFGECKAFSYKTELPNIEACSDYQVCTLCGESEFPACP